MLLLALTVCLGQGELYVEGPPFLPFGETAEYRLSSVPAGAEVEWKIADAPGGCFADVVTCPRFESARHTIPKVHRIRLTSVGTTPGDVRIVVTFRRNSRKIAAVHARVRLGRVLRVRAWCRVVEHARGGTRRPELFVDPDRRKSLEDDVNRLLRPCGVEVSLERGAAVAGRDVWFTEKGRFQPVVMKSGRKARSRVYKGLIRNNQRDGLNIYLLRDCHWREVRDGFGKVVTEHQLQGVGMEAGDIVIDDSAGAVTLAHELGHAFGLADLEGARGRNRLMYSVSSLRTGTAFVRREMLDARASARRHLRLGRTARR